MHIYVLKSLNSVSFALKKNPQNYHGLPFSPCLSIFCLLASAVCSCIMFDLCWQSIWAHVYKERQTSLVVQWCQRRGHGFNPWSRKIPHALGQLSTWAKLLKPGRSKARAAKQRSLCSETAARRSWRKPRTATQTQRGHANKHNLPAGKALSACPLLCLSSPPRALWLVSYSPPLTQNKNLRAAVRSLKSLRSPLLVS